MGKTNYIAEKIIVRLREVEVFVRGAYRGRKIGEALMRALESEAGRQGHSYLVLETGDPLVAATGLYKKMSYRPIENYGPYADMPGALCMGKKISG